MQRQQEGTPEHHPVSHKSSMELLQEANGVDLNDLSFKVPLPPADGEVVLELPERIKRMVFLSERYKRDALELRTKMRYEGRENEKKALGRSFSALMHNSATLLSIFEQEIRVEVESALRDGTINESQMSGTMLMCEGFRLVKMERGKMPFGMAFGGGLSIGGPEDLLEALLTMFGDDFEKPKPPVKH